MMSHLFNHLEAEAAALPRQLLILCHMLCHKFEQRYAYQVPPKKETMVKVSCRLHFPVNIAGPWLCLGIGMMSDDLLFVLVRTLALRR